MKFSPIALVLYYGLLATAQRVAVELPLAGTSVSAGSTITVKIIRPTAQSSSTGVALVVGFASCPAGKCLAPTEMMGSILYNGPFNPTSDQLQGSPYQNVSVTIPSSASQGPAQLNIVHVGLVGAGQVATLETLNTTVNIVGPSEATSRPVRRSRIMRMV